LSRSQIEQLVKTVVKEVVRVLGSQSACSSNCRCEKDPYSASGQPEVGGGAAVHFEENLLTEEKLLQLAGSDCRTVQLTGRCLVTPLARDRAAELNIRLQVIRGETPPEPANGSSGNRLAIVAARCSRSEEKALQESARRSGWDVHIEAVTGDSFKDLAQAVSSVSELIGSGRCKRAVILDENIFRISQLLDSPGPARAAICWDEKSAVESRLQGDSNILLLSNRLLGMSMLGRIVRAWLKED